MGNRRFARITTSDDEDEAQPPSRFHSPEMERQQPKQRRRKKIKLPEEEEEREKETQSGDEEAPQEDAKPIGDAVRVSGKGRGRRSHYEAFEFDGNRYDLEDPVLLVPEDEKQKPYVAIIKDITQTREGSIMVTGQWFYRPEEAEKKGGGSWKSSDTRELFYSFHRDEVPAESVMHKCVVHFVPLNKQLPNRKQFPGFIVQRVYDTVERKLWRLTDKDYEDNLQHEVDLLVQKTRSRLGELFDIEIEEVVAEQEDQTKSKRTLRKKNMSPLDVTRDDEATTRFDQHLKPETPGSCTSNMSEYYTILVNFKALTGETHRDKWLEKLLQGIQSVCCSDDDVHRDDKEKGGSGDSDHASDNNRTETAHGSDAKSLTNNPLLARRLLNGELEPSKILNMSPNELKEGLTAEETAKKEPEELKRMQMTDARCKRCQERKVGVTDIIHAGNADRYQLECIACGNNWYAPRDEISTLNDGPSSARSVGTAPWATAKFEDVEKKLVSPRESEKLEALKKTTEPYMPVLDSQKSFGKPKNEDNPASAKTSDNSGSTKVTE
ncbi:uncharacterized protein LOC117931964 isoform X2 [Vitis riparia]|uniref:uncharacterized protein LOC117931964 isoform X2 n=1 Tax=Vitis riparia TaxID=96939 RepID=UPI00155AB67A|nr:uncharacterized protein LOC117931964 isoform X2 [Vitis riparia]